MSAIPSPVFWLAGVVTTIRPEWASQTNDCTCRAKCACQVAAVLAAAKRPFADLAWDALDAARNPDLRSHRVLATHRAPDRPIVETPPAPKPKCSGCGEKLYACRCNKAREIPAEYFEIKARTLPNPPRRVDLPQEVAQ